MVMGYVPSMACYFKISHCAIKRVLIFLSTFFLFNTCLFAGSLPVNPNYGPSVVDWGNDNYVYWGSEELDSKAENGIKIDIKKPSIASQWVDIEVKVDYAALVKWGDKIHKFLILANNKVVDEFEPRLVSDDTGVINSGTYYIKPSQSYFIGTRVQFQCVAVVKADEWSNHPNAYYGCLWSARSETFKFDPLPVSDENTHAWLLRIYNLLEELLNAILDKLNYISKQIATLLTPSPAAQAKLEKSIDNLLDKTPFNEDLKNLSDTVKNTSFEDPTGWKFGDKKDWFRIGLYCNLFDFTVWADIIKTIRKFLDLCVWVVFFYFIIFYLLPRLDL